MKVARSDPVFGSVVFRSEQRFPDDVAKLFALVEHGIHAFRGQQFGLDDHTNPDSTLSKLLENDSHFVNEIVLALRATSFSVVGRGSSSGSDELTSNVFAHPRIRHRVNDFADTHREVQKTLFEFVGFGFRQLSISNFQSSILNAFKPLA
jgi:hypothetical protein